ncbi:glutathione S-transferase family protein [Hyphococcus flavus]|uniref:Glutathione S-transferase family protein n=1 Tax=Hyphococcus flavus TaxID=1866326 RepID=A0AAE9ZAJ4_9PROT|nr:glutathione S-transferase family protein [Hyphococcus flavus]WDI30664.1 glutathione S-transferase family protein [Hyphococcus flavus]
MAKPVLYHMPQTRGGTTMWMNEELGGVCDVKLINMKAGEQKQPDFLKINPMGKIPALVHGGVAVTEAAAICAYLADAFPQANLAPAANDPKRGAYFRWMFFAPSCIEPMMLDKFADIKRENTAAVGFGTEADVLNAIKAAIGDGPFLLGEKFTAADVVFGSTLNFAMMFGAIEKTEPFASYTERLMSRPAVKRAMEKNGQYMKELGLE